jgi:hypothetical protein
MAGTILRIYCPALNLTRHPYQPQKQLFLLSPVFIFPFSISRRKAVLSADYYRDTIYYGSTNSTKNYLTNFNRFKIRPQN